MLKDFFIASVLRKGTAQPNAANKDVGIFVQEFKPISKLKASSKKNSTNRYCLAVSQTHIFACQADKAVINVYDISSGVQEATVPFPERISCCTLTGQDGGSGILAIGTEHGRLLLWELCTGRLVSTLPSHLEAISCITSDPMSNFLLTGSQDSNIHVWSLAELLSFSSNRRDQSEPPSIQPCQTFSDHRAAVTGLVTGNSHSIHNFAASISKDKTCLVWDYRTGDRLCTFLLSATASCLAIDPVQRALFAGYDDGSIQKIELIRLESRPMNSVFSKEYEIVPIQLDHRHRWQLSGDNPSAILALELSNDGSLTLSGHEDGKVRSWDVSKGHFNSVICDLNFPVTNIFTLPSTGFVSRDYVPITTLKVMKPKHEGVVHGTIQSSNLESTIPANYCLTARLTSSLSLPRFRNANDEDTLHGIFDSLLEHSSFPHNTLEYYQDSSYGYPPRSKRPLNTSFYSKATSNLADDASLEEQLAISRKLNEHAMAHITRLTNEIKRLRGMELARDRAKKVKRLRRAKTDEITRRRAMGEEVDQYSSMVENADDEDVEGFLTSTDDFDPSE